MLTVEDLLDWSYTPLATARDLIESCEKSDLLHEDIEGHDVTHMKRVTVLAAYIAEHEKAFEYLEQILDAALFHDCGRTNGGIDRDHGAESYARYRTEFSEDEVTEFLMTYHCREDDEAKEALESFDKADRPAIWKAYCVLRDADAVDRIRLGVSDCVDPRYLHFIYSKKLVGVARELQQKYRF